MLRTILRLCWRAQLTEGLGGLEGSKNPNRDRDRDTGGTGCSFWPSHLRDAGGDVRSDPGSRHRGEEAGSQGVPGGDGNVRVWLVNWGEKTKRRGIFWGCGLKHRGHAESGVLGGKESRGVNSACWELGGFWGKRGCEHWG